MECKRIKENAVNADAETRRCRYIWMSRDQSVSGYNEISLAKNLGNLDAQGDLRFFYSQRQPTSLRFQGIVSLLFDSAHSVAYTEDPHSPPVIRTLTHSTHGCDYLGQIQNTLCQNMPGRTNANRAKTRQMWSQHFIEYFSSMWSHSLP